MPATEDIEQRVDANRRRLAETLSGLSGTVAPQSVAEQLSAAANGYGGELGRQAITAAKRNPAALVLAGAGLALLFTGNGSSRPRTAPPPPAAVPPEAAFAGFDARVAAADAAIKEEMTGMSEENLRAGKMRETLNAGLDVLPAAARKRVLKARTAALQAQEKVESHAAKAGARSRTFYDQNPLAAGAIALGLGALIGALLPSTRQEDEMLGARRDALAAKAEAALREEMDKLHRTASASLDTRPSRPAPHTAAG
ncbi:hypothetical protein [Leisingera methylohalidivorans]|uniref:DUF3618 domain-containing protein n=1 Tax=Leisingera methylohalidivorans DSM 14336 TaxID=999552 RepID=V9VX37_9RHOB|nr:hypothetical protein [Leisingera methylohalidivorans]AHD02523.1 hypothetical protein METH_19485 [Leisingera methylohalidivorans DSM 14336]